MTPLVKKISVFIIIAVAFPTAVLAADVDFQLQISPPSSIGITGYSGGSGVFEPSVSQPAAGQTSTVSGWTSPNAFIEIFSGNQILGTATANNDGLFTVNSVADDIGPIIVRTTDKSGATAVLTTPIDLSSQPTAALGIILPPTISLSAPTVAPGSAISGNGQTVPGGTVSISLTDAKGKTATQFPVVDADGKFSFSFDTVGLETGPVSLQASLNFNAKTAATILKGAIEKNINLSNGKQSSPGPATNTPGQGPGVGQAGSPPPAINRPVPPPANSFRPNSNNPTSPRNTPTKTSMATAPKKTKTLVLLAISAILIVLALYFVIKSILVFLRKK
jgi:hypothetical protein